MAVQAETSLRDQLTVVFRTHFWDDTVNFCVENVEKCCSAEIVVSADETSGEFAVPSRFRKISHSVDSFVGYGLPTWPSREEVMWYSGDYVLYQLLDHIQTDYVLVMEGDSTAIGPLDDVLLALIRDGVEYSPRKIFPSKSLTDRLGSYFEKYYPGRPKITGPFPSIFISKKVIRTLLAERLLMAERISNPGQWVYCEHFVATTALQAGHKVSAFGGYADITLHGWLNPVRPEVVVEADDSVARFFHPVLPSPKWEQKRIAHLEKEVKNYRRQIDRLKRMVSESGKQGSTS